VTVKEAAMIRSLLVAVDSSAHAQAALEHGVELAGLHQARVTGLHVLDVRFLEMPPYMDYSYAFEAVPPILAPLDVMDKSRAKAERILSDVRARVEKAGLVVEVRVEEGVPGQVISDIAEEHDLVVLGKRGEHAKWGRDLLGSTAEAVIRRSAIPVLLAEEQAHPLKSALVLFDGSEPADRGLRFAADLATRAPIELRVLTVDDDPKQGQATLDIARAYLEPLGLRSAFSVLSGRVSKAAAAALAKEPADLLVMGMRGHSAFMHLILGHTTEQLMRSSQIPVLLVP
jgi:nucleotide-binding universal stress UspA family protein